MAAPGPSLAVELSGEWPDVGLAELRAVTAAEAPGTVADLLAPRLALLTTPGGRDPDELARTLGARLAYSHSIDRFLGVIPRDRYPAGIADLPIPPGTVCVRAIRAGAGARPGDVGEAQRALGGALDRKVDLDRPDVLLHVYLTPERLVTTRLAVIDRGAFGARTPSKRPFFSPISLHPWVGRCLVNLAGVRRGSVVLDPFCGTGGILMEAALIGCRVYGSDVLRRMVYGTSRNLGFVGATAERLVTGDIEAVEAPSEALDAVVTDLPYGRSSTMKREPRESLYRRAFLRIADILAPGRRAVCMTPDASATALLPPGLRLDERLTMRVHRSLTRHILVCTRL